MIQGDGIQVDASRCYALFRRLNTKNQRKVSRAALRGAANKLKREATKNLRQSLGVKYRAPAKGIKVVARNAEQAKVHIMGDYRLKWFEKGTDPRYTKGRRGRGKKIPLRRPSFRGKIFRGGETRERFFAKAVKAKEQDVARDIETELVKHIRKQAKREGITLI